MIALENYEANLYPWKSPLRLFSILPLRSENSKYFVYYFLNFLSFTLILLCTQALIRFNLLINPVPQAFFKRTAFLFRKSIANPFDL
jgi:hypothetical protein